MTVIFKLNPEPTFRATVSIPAAGSGDVELDIEFRRKTKDDLQKYFKPVEKSKTLDKLLEVIVAWHNCDSEFNRDNLATLLQNYPKADVCIIEKYGQESLGAREGN